MNVLDDIVRLVVENCSPDRIILFGSYAYGTPTPQSDIDICVIKSGLKFRMSLQAKLTEALIHLPAEIHVTALNSSQVNRGANATGALRDILTKGKVLYDKTGN